MSGETTPILSGAIPAFEIFMTKWEKIKKGAMCLKPLVEAGLEKAFKYYDRMDGTKAYAIAMCKQANPINLAKTNLLSAVINPSIRLSWIKKHWEPSFIDTAENNIWQLVGLVGICLFRCGLIFCSLDV
jgi:hypothetical protein